MKTIARSLPDLSKAWRLAALSVKLEKISDETVFGLAIKIALKKKDLKRCIEMIREQSIDNRQLVSDIIGKDILKEIENISHI